MEDTQKRYSSNRYPVDFLSKLTLHGAAQETKLCDKLQICMVILRSRDGKPKAKPATAGNLQHKSPPNESRGLSMMTSQSK